ncbi:MAG: hypothetical protein U0136_16820 [Bdellovibrionota bacterium]
MKFQKLEITRLNDQSEIKRRIVCLAGRINVFRARDESELAVFADALSGKPTAERFSILLDGQTFDPKQHLYIGFDPLPLQSETRSVAEYMRGKGASDSALEGLLLGAGLGGLARATCAELGDVQQQLLQLLGATFGSDQVIFMNDPFVHIAEQWREPLAEKFAEAVWTNQTIIVVVRLNVRPECWIDNPYIARLQLEKPRERTIGFGGGELSSADLVASLREHLKQTDSAVSPLPLATAPKLPASGQLVRRAQKPVGVLTAVPKKQRPPFISQKHALFGLGGLCFALLLVILTGSPRAREESVRFDPVRPSRPPAATAPAAPSGPATVVTGDRAAPAAPVRPADLRPETKSLDAYPVEVRNVVLKAFHNPKEQLNELPSFPQKPASASPPTPVPPTGSFVAPPPPAPTEDRSAGVPLYEPQTIMEGQPDSDQLEAQRQLLRQHFLEAVARAREHQMERLQGYPGAGE